MKILVSCLAFDEGKSGISDYIVSTVKEMIIEHEVFLLIHPSDASIFPLSSDKLHFRYVAEWIKRPLISMFWHLFILPFSMNFNFYDLFFLPAGNRRLMAHYPKRTVVTFHDLSQFHIPSKYDGFRMFYIKKIIPYFLRKAPCIYAISENTKKDLIRFYAIPANKIEVNYNGYNPQKLENPISLEELHNKFNLHKKYMLYIARVEHPGKNHMGLLKAYDLLPNDLMAEYDLVCAGGLWNGGEIVMQQVTKLQHPENIHFVGFVSNQEMASLYKNASLYVFPSLYEGFGIPVLEAFAAGIPVICSDRSSLPEIGGTAVLTFNPDKPQSIVESMKAVLTNPNLQNDMIQRGKDRLQNFSWYLHTQRIINSFKLN